MVAKHIRYKFGTTPTKEVRNRQYFPTPEITRFIADLRARIKADTHLDEQTRAYTQITLTRLLNRVQAGKILSPMLDDRAELQRSLRREEFLGTSETKMLIEKLAMAKSSLPTTGEFTPVQIANLYLLIHGK